tara:strand:+ start:278 stop:523 length:246 start_codon:yes stop_codon:yes gene_type:complete
MSLDTINNKAFELFLLEKHKKIIKSINIDNKLMGIDLIDDKSEYIKIKAIYLWNNMEECIQQKYIDKFKDKLDISYDFTEL